jgi:predicted RNase H-like HicB family nuclease
MKLKVVVHPAEEGGFWAEAPALPGCVTQGESLEEVKDNMREAIEGWLAARSELHPESPDDQLVEIEV